MSADLDLVPPFKHGELLTIQRQVDGKNVMMFVRVTDPCSLYVNRLSSSKKPEARLTINGWIKSWGESPYADGRVENQRQAINRLLKHLQEHCTDEECQHRIGE